MISIVPYSVAPTGVSGTNFEFAITGDGSSTTLVVDLRSAPISTSIKAFADKIIGVFSVSSSGGLTISSSSVSAHQLTLVFATAPSGPPTAYTISIAFEVDPT